MEHVGVSKPVVGITVPTGYSFNLDGTAIYLTMAALFVADAMGKPMSIGEQVGLLLFMIIASKGAAGVTGAGLATLAGGLQSHRPDLLDGVGLIVGIDRFMSEARALTNFAGNAVATVLVGTWTGEFDRA
ncbi:Sodium:dicarboxylate symporter family protein [Micromonospora haikouensis]|uniref:Sodium:dicarboxylate symporter family protein n=2 Tax=Micromonospora TaxID=1873 RepID=A0A1C4XYV1_9ACTN|nr:cation:dicarboxylase symporter family transporter [Micromonospora haikouensis]SCF13659.1 Sodium:dicarboxylate symporter family protein [Micromonospora haikouensis]